MARDTKSPLMQDLVFRLGSIKYAVSIDRIPRINGSLEFVPEYYNPEDTEIKYGHLTIDCSLDRDLQELKAKEYYPLIDKIFQTLS